MFLFQELCQIKTNNFFDRIVRIWFSRIRVNKSSEAVEIAPLKGAYNSLATKISVDVIGRDRIVSLILRQSIEKLRQKNRHDIFILNREK